MNKSLLGVACAVVVLTLVNRPAGAADTDAIKRAIDGGVAHLKQTQNADGSWGMNSDRFGGGATALVALTLLECDVPPDDAQIKKAAEYVRYLSVNQNNTYSIALAILFLDKLREPGDVPLIESLTVRLLAGQSSQGGWSYECPPISDQEVKRLTDILKNRTELVGKREVPKGDEPRRSPKDLPKEIVGQIALVNQGQVARAVNDGLGRMNRDDNSNTQFATLALWVGRRHGLPVDKAVGLVNLRFRNSVNPDGGWGYIPSFGIPRVNDSQATMTCAGLLGLTVAYGVATEMVEEKAEAAKDKESKPRSVQDPSKDPVLTRAIAVLATAVGHPTAKLKELGRPADIPRIGNRSYYFLWSLERACLALDLDTIGGKDWYEWGSELILANQAQDGSWQADHARYRADTCFALLFLKRANLVRDLSAKMKGKLDHKALRGGVGIEGLKEKLGGGVAGPKEGDRPGEGKESDRLAAEVVEARGERQTELLTKLRDTQGQASTDALVIVIGQTNGDARKSARKALAERLAKDGPDKLTAYLEDREVEIRRAAALACALCNSKAHVSQLIALLGDREQLVSRAAWAALKNLTNQDFGPALDATDADKDKAIKAWQAWWAKNGK
jgi:HEAT repeat protein